MQFSLGLDTERGYNKKRIITSFFYNQSSTIPELAKELNLSIPTITKIINEMVEEGLITDYGKSDSKAGRKPSTYGLNPLSGFFIGVDIKHNHINLGLCNFNGEIIHQEFDIPYERKSSPQEDVEAISQITLDFIKTSGVDVKKILNACVNIGGRVNPATGYSYSLFAFPEIPVSEVFSDQMGIPVCIENDTRAMTYGEFLRGSVDGEKNVLYVNLGWGLGLGIIINGVIYEGKSGFAGELGHTNVFDNEIMCHCGKKGCMETEVSGMALRREIIESIKNGKSSILSKNIENGEDITLSDIVEAINSEDFLCIDLLEEIGEKLGKQLANIINIFNPELVVIGGTLSAAGDYLLQPIRLAVKKHSLKLVSNDSKIVCSKLYEKAGIIGACMTARRQMFEETL